MRTDTITATVEDTNNDSFSGTASATVTLTSQGDSDGDGVPDDLEGNGDRDGDGIPDSQDYDPTGYFYDSATGEIIPGGQISVSCDIGTVAFVGGNDGNAGFYQYTVSGVGNPSTCTQTVSTIPPGYILDTACPSLGQLSVPTGPAPHVLGAGESGSTGFLSSAVCVDNPYYDVFVIELGDAFVLNNNIAIRRSGIGTVPIPTLSQWALVILSIWLGGTGLLRIRG